MQTATVPLIDKLQQSLDINSSVRLIAEWNHNRYSTISSVVNTGTPIENEYDNELFPLSSIVEPERPEKGIVVAWASPRTGVPQGRTSAGYEDRVNGARYLTASVNSKYKYWTSVTTSAAGSPFAITGVLPSVVYTSPIWSNKIRVALENSYSSPTAYTVSVTTDGTNWSVISTNPTISANGVIELYRQANGTWSTTVYRENPQAIRGVRITVTNMDQGGARFNLIELGARLESDLSQFVVDYNVDNSMSEHSFAAPLGVASSNTGSVNLDNTDSRFTNDNPASLYYGLLDKNVDMRLDVGLNLGTIAVPNYEWFRQITMRTETWNGQTPDGTEVSLTDASEFLQSVKPLPVFWQNMTVGEIIWRLLDSVGFSKWKYEPRDDDPSTLVPNFWASGEDSVWEVIVKIAEATQTAVYFDELGVLQIKTRSAAYDLTAPVSWNLDATLNGLKQPDIVELTKTYDYEANRVDIIYKPTELLGSADSGLAIMESVWEPEDTVTLRSSQLKTAMTTGSTTLTITPGEASVWPYAGIVQIEGEFIRYTKKGYNYRNASGVLTSTYIASNDEKIALDKLNPALAYQNSFNGILYIGTVANRGIWNTSPLAHSVDISGWTFNRYRTTNGAVTAWNGGRIHNPDRSTMSLRTNKTFTPNTWYVCTRGATLDTAPNWYGTRMKFDLTGGATHGMAGLVISAGTNDAGYFVELIRTSAITPAWRTATYELCFYVRYTNGTIKRIGPNGGKGVAIAVTDGIWYDLDVHFFTSGSTRYFSIMVNGITKMTCTVPTGDSTGEVTMGRYGFFTRGFTSVEFEYLYSSTDPVNDTFDSEGWWDRIKGGYQSGQWDREWVYNYRTTTRIIRGKKVTAQARYASRLMDEFGPIVHEVREFDVKFTKTPVLNSNLYFSNESQVICPEYNANPFGAKFVLANTSRDNAIVNGEDTLMFGSDNPVDQKMLIYAKTFKQDEDKTLTVRDDAGIKRRGEVSLEINNEWIQSEAGAKAVGDWIVRHWSGGADEIEAEVFGNPLLQLADIVSVNYPARNMATATHKYFIIKISHNYDNGLETTLTLRRVKI